MSKNDHQTAEKRHTQHQPTASERATAEQTDQEHQWYVRTYMPQAILSVGINGPGQENKSLEGILLSTDKDISEMARGNMFLQSEEETSLDVGKEYRLSAAEGILNTTPKSFEVLAGNAIELVSYGALGQGLAPAPFEPVLGGEEDGGVESIEDTENARKANAKSREAAAQAMKGQHDGHHNTMTVIGGVFTGVELIMGGFFAYKSYKNKAALAAATGGVGTVGGGATFVVSYFQDKNAEAQGLGLAKMEAAVEAKIYGGKQVNILAGQFAKVEACCRVFIESAGMVSASGSFFAAFGAINAEVMGGMTAGLLAGMDAEVNGGRNVTIEAQYGSISIMTAKTAAKKAINIKNEGPDSDINLESEHGSIKIEAHKDIHVDAEEAVHVKSKGEVGIESEKSGDDAVVVHAKDGGIVVSGKKIQIQAEDEISLLLADKTGITIKSGQVVINDGSIGHKFSGGRLDSVSGAALASARKQFKSLLSKLNQRFGQLKSKVDTQHAQLRSLKTGKA